MQKEPAAKPATETESSKERYVILAHGKLDVHDAKTALALLRYRPETVVAILDRDNAGRTSDDVLAVGGAIPVVATLDRALELGAERLLIGTAPAGGGLPQDWRDELVAALDAGLDLYSGLHMFLNDDPELSERAAGAGRQMVDLRAVPGDLSTPNGARERVAAPVVLTVGSDCNVGKMTVSWELMNAARSRGIDARFVATGQTGVLLAGRGLSVDRVISDFVAGATERIIEEAWMEGGKPAELVLVEGQGSLIHPFYSAVTLGLLHGARADKLILCHSCTRETVRHCPDRPIPPLDHLVSLYEQAAAWIDPAPVVGVALATRGLDNEGAKRALEQATAVTGLPSEDVVRFPSGVLLDAVWQGGA
jgi:uncharacterized NAD-dependent epimerase/dehydratase family protein